MGKRRATIKDIASIAGVSPAAVSKVFNNKDDISDDTKERILRIAKKLNYTPNEFAVNLVKKESKFIGIVLPVFKDTLFGDILDGIYDVLDRNGYTSFIYITWGNPDKEIQVIDYLIRKNVSGIILFSVFSKIKGKNEIPHITKLQKRKIPYVLIDRSFTIGKHNYVGVNNKFGGMLVGEHLSELNHKNVVYIFGENCTTVDDRYAGLRAGMLKNNQHINILKFENPRDMAYNTGYNSIYALKSKLKDYTAIFCASDSIAFGALVALSEINIKVPDDISLVGFDDLLFSKVANLTTVAYDREYLGVRAAEIVLKGRNKIILEQLEPKLIVRKTTRGV